MTQPIPKRTRKRRRKLSDTDRPERDAEPRPSLEGEYERDAGARAELDELERAEREQRRILEGEPPRERRNAEE